MLRRRHILLGIFAILLLFATFAAFEINWAFTASSDRDTDYGAQIDALVAARQSPAPGEPNQWPEFVAAIHAFYASFDNVRKAGTQPATYTANFGWPADFDAVRAGTAPPDVAAATASTLAAIAADPAANFGPRLDALARARHFVRPIGGSVQPLYETLLPELGEARQLARHELLMLQRAYRADDADAARAHLSRVLLISRVIGEQGCLIDQAVGDAIRNFTFEELSALMIERPPDAAMIDAITAAAIEQFPGFETPALFVAGEQVFSLDIIQRTFESSGYGRGRFIPSEALSLPFLSTNSPVGAGFIRRDSRLQNMLWFGYASRAQTEDKLQEFYDLIQSHLDAPPSTRQKLPSLDQFMQNLPPRYAVLQITLPAISVSINKSRLARDQFRALRIILAIERYRIAHGQPPSDLASLVPTLLTDLPTSTLSGGPFLYKRLEAPDSAGRIYILYLPGADNVDNGGTARLQPEAEAAAVKAYGMPLTDPYLAAFNQRAAQGLDFILTRPRQQVAK